MNGLGQGFSYGKRQPQKSWRGPWPSEPVEAHLRFWGEDVAECLKGLEAAKAARDARRIVLYTKQLKEAKAKLAEAQARADREGVCAPKFACDYPDAEPGQLLDIRA